MVFFDQIWSACTPNSWSKYFFNPFSNLFSPFEAKWTMMQKWRKAVFVCKHQYCWSEFQCCVSTISTFKIAKNHSNRFKYKNFLKHSSKKFKFKSTARLGVQRSSDFLHNSYVNVSISDNLTNLSNFVIINSVLNCLNKQLLFVQIFLTFNSKERLPEDLI